MSLPVTPDVQLLTTLTQLLTTVIIPPNPINCGRRHERGLLGSCPNPEDTQTKPSFNQGNSSTAWFGEFPWLASVRGAPKGSPKSALPACGGVLVHPQAVLVPGGCYEEAKSQGLELTVRLAEFRINTNVDFGRSPVDAGISSAIFHPKYKKVDQAVAYDVALLILDRPVPLTDDVDIVCLPWWSDLQRRETLSDDWETKECLVTGWNDPRTSSGDGIRYEKVQYISRESCQRKLRNVLRLGPFQELHESFICAEPDSDCWADIGSVLVCRDTRRTDRWTLVGMVPWSRLYQQCDTAVSFSNVEIFADWIQTAVTAHLSVSA